MHSHKEGAWREVVLFGYIECRATQQMRMH